VLRGAVADDERVAPARGMVATRAAPFLRTIDSPGQTDPVSFFVAAGAAPIDVTPASAAAATASRAVMRIMRCLLRRLTRAVLEAAGEA
jgi:hypothetical protein